MTGGISTAAPVPAPWQEYDVEATERDEVARIGADVDSKITALKAEIDAAKGPYLDLLEREKHYDPKAENRVMGWSLAAAFTAIGAVGGAVLGGAKGRLAGAGAGSVLGAIAGGFIAMKMTSPYNPTPSPVRSAGDQKIVDRYKQALAKLPNVTDRGGAQPLPFQQEAASTWVVGGDRNAGARGTIADFLRANVATFDHDGDGVIDLSAGSAELVRDADTGGPVTSDTRNVRHLASMFVKADANGDHELSPEEAVRGTVQTAILGEDSIWWFGPDGA